MTAAMSQQQPSSPAYSSDRPVRHMPSLSRPQREVLVPTLDHVLQSERRRQTYKFPQALEPFLSPPPYCKRDPLSEKCRGPTQPPVAPSSSVPKGKEGPIILAAGIGGMLMMTVMLLFCFFVRKSRQLALRQQHQQQGQPVPEPAVEIIPEPERRRQMEDKLKLIRPEDIVEMGEANHSCSICLNDFDLGDKISGSVNSDCRHYFHTECILQAFLQRPKTLYECPVCRRDFFDVQPSTETSKVEDRASERDE